MAEPSGVRNFFGGIVDRILPGSNYNRQTGQYSNIGKGLVGRGASIVGSLVGGPLVGRAINTAAGNYIDTGSATRFGYGTGPLARIAGRDANDVGPVVPEAIGGGRPGATNLGLGTGVNPYQGWTNYMADPGSRDNFGNNYLGGGYTGAGFNPSSAWGRNLLNTPNTNPGSIQNFGNNLDALRGGRERIDGGGMRRTDPNRDLSNRNPRYGDPRQLLTSRNPYNTA